MLNQTESFDIPFGTLFQGDEMSLVILSDYHTDGYGVGNYPKIATTMEYPAGLLCFQGASELPEPQRGFFRGIDEELYKRTLAKVRVIAPGDNTELLKEVLEEAVQQLDSNNPRFMYYEENCFPIPNFMQEREWPKIAGLIRKFLEGEE